MRFWLVFLLVLADALPAGSAARAAELEFRPVRVELTATRRVSFLTIANTGQRPVTMDVRRTLWRQAGNEDVLSDTKDIIVSPPVFELAPGHKQIVRVGLRPNAGGGERTFRLLFREVAAPAVASGSEPPLTVSVPVFMETEDEPPAKLAFAIVVGGDGSHLQAINDGGQHAQIGDVRLDGRPLKDVGGYVLAGATRRWPVDARSAVRISFESEAGPVNQPLQTAGR